MTKITESHIEEMAINLLESQGFQYLYGPNIAPDSDNPQRSSFFDVLLVDKVKTAIDRINPTIPQECREIEEVETVKTLITQKLQQVKLSE